MPGSLCRCSVVLGLVTVLWPAGLALAQLPASRLNNVYPCGGRQGTSVECSIGGNDIEEADGLDFSHPGIKAEKVGLNRFKVAIAKDVPVGPYDVRAVTARGLSSFRSFKVSDWPEAVEADPNDSPESAQKVELPVVLNGHVEKPTDADFYRFSAKRGQRVTIDCWASRVDSLLDGTLMIFDAKGKELGYSGDFRGKDPFLDFTAPEDGEYVVKIWDFIYGGSSDHVYRLWIGSVPHLDAVIPAAIKPGPKTSVTLLGRNLPGGTPVPGTALEAITQEIGGPVETLSLRGGEPVHPPQSRLDGMAYHLSTADGSSNPVFVGFTEDPIVIENEPNNSRASAQKLTIPSDVTGTFAPAGDVDWYSIHVGKGETVVVETFGERQSGQIDPFFSAFEDSGKKVVAEDDAREPNIGQLRFATNTHDTRWEFTAPKEGDYALQVRDLYYQQRGESRFVYRLSVRRPRPDFRLMVVPIHDVHPDATTVGRGGRNWMDVLLFRIDGFDKPVRIEATDLPQGVTSEPIVIGAGKTSGPLVFHGSMDAPIGHGRIRVRGTATLDGHEIERDARAGGITWATVNTPANSRLVDGIMLAVRDQPPFVLTATPGSATTKAGGTVPVTVKVERAKDWTGPVQLYGFDLPPNANVGLVNVAPGATEATVQVVLPANVSPGKYTFTINGGGQAPQDYMAQRDPKKRKGNNLRALFPSNPITIEVTDRDGAGK